jgi:signal transduction histidine kinase/HD-like signal output (HDOD) protein
MNAPMNARRVELILQQLESLPTLNAVAVRVIELTTSDSSAADDVVAVISSDPALAGKVLQVSRRVDRTRGGSITTIERAVVHLGFEAVRSIALSVQIFDLFDGIQSAGGEVRDAATDIPAFDRLAFWHHSLAVGCVSQALAPHIDVPPAEAFLAGLMHDLGLLALHVLLPRSIDRVCRLAEAGGVSIDHACSKVIGITTTTAGRRLAERWNLPPAIADAIWLHGQRFSSLPGPRQLPHRELVGVVTLADTIARARYLTLPGHGSRGENIAELCNELGIDPRAAAKITDRLADDVGARSASLGLGLELDTPKLLRAVTRANDTLGRLNSAMRQKSQRVNRQAQSIRRIIEFHQSQSIGAGDSLTAAMERVANSARELFGEGLLAMLVEAPLLQPSLLDVDAEPNAWGDAPGENESNDPAGADRPLSAPTAGALSLAAHAGCAWQLVQFAGDGRIVRSDIVEAPLGSESLAALADRFHVSVGMMGILPWLSDYLGEAHDVRNVRLLPLSNAPSSGVCAVLLHESDFDTSESREELDALTRTWAAAIIGGMRHDASRALGDELAEANRQLIEAQDALTRTLAMAALGEIIAGAAHEMNNPLAVISGRAQLLAQALTDPTLKETANLIASQSHRLGDMISTLRSFTEPARPRRRPTDLGQLIMKVVSRFEPRGRQEFTISTVFSESLPEALVDAEQMSEALAELVRNAVEAKDARHIEVRVHVDPIDDRLRIQVRDDGVGLSEHALAHAFEPFFSEKPAGRQPGLGLPRARRFVHGHGGRITLENAPPTRTGRGGAVATIWLDRWRAKPRQEGGLHSAGARAIGRRNQETREAA